MFRMRETAWHTGSEIFHIIRCSSKEEEPWLCCGQCDVFVFMCFSSDSFTCLQCSKWTLLFLSKHLTPPVHIYLSGTALSLSSPSILECPNVWRALSRILPPTYLPFHLFLPPLSLLFLMLCPLSALNFFVLPLWPPLCCSCFFPALSNALSCSNKFFVCVNVCICVSSSVTRSRRKLGWLTLIATRCRT